PAPGFITTSIRVLESVYLTGPENEISVVSTVSSESLVLSNLAASTERRLRLPPLANRHFRLEPDSVTITVKIEPEVVRTFAGVNLSVFKPASRSVTVRPAQAQISVSGAEEVVRNLTIQSIAATLKITDTVPRGTHRLPIEIALPPGLTLVRCDPALFEVEVN
ncbi:MAG: hypothetical protein ABIK62_01500, partial [candidate division WOR-3 bacterium]